MILRGRIGIVFFIIVVLLFLRFHNRPSQSRIPPDLVRPPSSSPNDHGEDKFNWARVPQRNAVTSMMTLPSPSPGYIPKIQARFPAETADEGRTRMSRLKAVKGNFTHAWNGYKKHAWLRDEVAPLSGRSFDPFGGWAATLVDALDTLWIMDLHEEFKEAVDAIGAIDFSTCALDEINVFETTIRYLGGFLSAHDLSRGKYPVLRRKAEEMGDMLYVAFDTPNRMPITRWKFKEAAAGSAQEAPENMLVAEIGSLTLEFTRLSQITGNPRYYDAVQRIMNHFEAQQDDTKLPGMWPVVVNARKAEFTGADGFTIGGMADSMYEYLPKQYLLLGGASSQYQRLYERALSAMKKNIFYRPMTPESKDILFAGQVNSDGKTPLSALKIDPQAQHLGCFAGGMVGLAARIFKKEEDISTARRLVEGCLWAYETLPQGVMPEVMHTVPCESAVECNWNVTKWHEAVEEAYGHTEDAETKIRQHHLPEGVSKIDDTRYILRPEAIESIFILYRLTGDSTLRERAWNMFNTIVKHTTTDIAHAALDDCTVPNPPKADRMESFWLAETLKYFYLIFSDPDVISLDEYVLNTEAHPLKRPN